MEITVWAYQITPGSDETLFFAVSEDACRAAALAQREELKRLDPDYTDLAAMALYEYRLRPMTAEELVSVLNEPERIIDTCAVSRRLVGLVVD
ncbi:hypothetical protein J2855_003666 [Agrobacterium tumefaciens]|uniref:hypothetical protein n=1 Tax=Agrobacterium tumefaciens TaxID=358 RepID=UPI000DCFE755|nr:hypothetical protein [Agrobacterium tumefaciens]MBP2510018.1 hypothetical protein [Agrobacterium tumefaciens]MBP2519462.1 hypothetical protein [Agrobacterium tumefaciens]MBP2578211.1 hypothetical protein [Agrobacterium tumefaciens]MBP2596157.1 hypothetical protein [Agrobacterium tumefaciens]